MKTSDKDALDLFVEGWGRMGTQWGISKVMAEIYALLYLSSRPLSLEEMSERLGTSRSNISTNVRALQDLGVVKKAIIRGERKDYYTVESDIQKLAIRIAEGKKKRELDPAIEIVDASLARALSMQEEDGGGEAAFYVERLKAMKNLMEMVNSVFEAFVEGSGSIEPPVEETEIPTRES